MPRLRQRPRFTPGRRDYPARSEGTASRSTAFRPAIMSEQIRRNYPEDYRKRFAEEEIPVGYWGEPEDLAALAVFLASPKARYITGAVIPVDGGLRRYQF